MRRGGGLLPDAGTLGQVFVGPDVHPLAGAVFEFAIHTGGQGGKFLAVGDGGGPAFQHFGQRAGLVGVNPHFIDAAQFLAAAHGAHKVGGLPDLGVHIEDVAAVGRGPARDLGIAALLAVFQAVVGPDVDDLVQGADFGVEKGGEGGDLFPARQGFAEVFLELGHAARFHVIGADFVDHSDSFSG